MKLYGILIYKNIPTGEPVMCSSAVDVSSFGFFQRGSAKEFIVFLGRTVAKRVTAGSKSQINEQEHVAYVHSTMEGLSAVAVCDKEYSSRVAFSMLQEVMVKFTTEFRGKYDRVDGRSDNFLAWPELEATLTRFQKPEEADKIEKIKKDIEDTKVVMYNAIDQVLERGEKIDNLVGKSEDLSSASKTFYKQAKKTNSSCCVVM